ncbi:MAG: MBL fold metallo-hydrolase [Thermoplasmatota archaeon]
MASEARILQVGGRGWDCNQFLLKDPKANAFDLVDAGHGQDWDQVIANVQQVIDPARVRSVVVTHEHLDHVNGLPRWRAMGARLVAPRGVADKLLAGHDPTSAMFGLDIPRLEVDDVVGDGDHVSLGGRDHAVLETPGHSPGSACYWDAGTATLFAGDTLFADGGIGRFDFPDGDVRLLYESILRLSKLPVRTLHCGHGPSPEGAAAARSVQGSVAHVTACAAQAGGPGA